MEKFEMDDEKSLEVFNNFVGKAKDTLTTLIENIKENIKKYEQAIEDTTKDISDNESSREKCEHEITKMESKIESIKENIDNVESTYKKMVDAYSSTSKGETKELYSDIIDGAKENCDKEVEKNRTEIARINSDIEAIKNNIAEFTKIVDDLNKNLEEYNTELHKYKKSLDYMEKYVDKTNADLENIATKKEETKKKAENKTKKEEVKVSADKVVLEEVEDEEAPNEKEKSVSTESDVKDESVVIEEESDNTEDSNGANNIFDIIGKNESFDLEEPKKTEITEKKVEVEPVNFEDSLKQIYDLTGYKPKKEEESKEEEKPVSNVKSNDTKPVYNENLENLFATPTPDKKAEAVPNTYDEDNMSIWENILNGADDILSNSNQVQTEESDGSLTTVDQLLKPYGTSFSRLQNLSNDKIEFKDGKSIPFTLSADDVIKAVNAVDSGDLKKMKIVGPEITLLKKVKQMKEGRN